jgi:hypothetical protein
LILIKASFVKSFVNGLLNLATASNSLLLLYIPTDVIYVCGLLINVEYNKLPLYSIFFIRSSSIFIIFPVSQQESIENLLVDNSSASILDLKLKTTDGKEISRGAKIGVCMEDTVAYNTMNPIKYDCNNQGSSRTWLYYAGNGQINMGEFFISCDMANRMANRYGLGQAESTVIEYSQEEAGPPIPRTRSIPILDITGSKVDSWIDFVQGFKPVR